MLLVKRPLAVRSRLPRRVEIINSTRGKGLGLLPEGKGIDLFRKGREKALDVFAWFGFAVKSVYRSEDRLLALGSLTTRGRYSGISVPVPLGTLWTIRDGRIDRVETFTSRKKAMAALGAPSPQRLEQV